MPIEKNERSNSVIKNAEKIAKENGYNSIGEYLIENIQSSEVVELLSDEIIRDLLWAEIAYITQNLSYTVEENDRLQEFVSQISSLKIEYQAMMARAVAEMDYAQEVVESYKKGYGDLFEELLKKTSKDKAIQRINRNGRPDEMGEWIQIDSPNNSGMIQ